MPHSVEHGNEQGSFAYNLTLF